jgi:hypothetical protein
MTRILTGLLAAQLLLTVVVFWPGTGSKENGATSPLLDFERAGVERIVISDDETSLVVSRAGDGWILPEYHGLPADPAKLTAALDTLPTLSRGWPVAQTASARQRFEVADDKYQRKLEYATGSESLGTVYLGTSPGFRKVHARPGDEEAVYSVEFNTFDLPVTESGWLDKTLLQVEAVDAVQGLDYQLKREAEAWVMADDQEPVAGVVEGLVNGLESLRVIGPVDIATAAILRETEVPPTLTVRSGEQSYEYRLFEIEDAYYIKRSDIDIYFSVSALDYDRLNDVNAGALLGQDEESAEDTGEPLAGEPESGDTADSE